MLRTLSSQLCFVRDVQNVDTTEVTPLRSVRDETLASQQEKEISLDSLQRALQQEENIGKRFKRIRQKNHVVDTEDAEEWNPLAHTDVKVGRYFVVDSQKD